MTRWILVALVVLAGTAHADRKFGKQVRFVGIHPIAKADGGGICYIEAPHVHIYTPNKLEYRMHGDDYFFVGDPVAYGWDGPKVKFKGAHPIHVDAVVGGDPDVEYCYLEGPHYHYFEPEDGPEFKVVGETYFYVAEPPKVMIEARPQYVGVNAVYRPMTYVRPAVEVEAPVGWIGARAEFGAPAAVIVDHRGHGTTIVEPAVGVHVGAEVHIPVPTVQFGVQIGGPAVIVKERGGPRHWKGKHKKFKGR